MKLNIFTIVLNGMPYLSRHLEQFRQLSIAWEWSIVHGLADPVNDTAWCKRLNSAPPDDGTIDYLHQLSDSHVAVVLKERWPGKTAMCNAALNWFTEPGILLQVDADECWTTAQLETLVRLFEAYPRFDCAAFLCRYFVGPHRVLTQPGTYGNHLQFEWLRAWRWAMNQRFITHEPPRLNGASCGMGHLYTAGAGLVFDHFAYADKPAVEFKEAYYGYAGAVDAWGRLNACAGPADIKDYLPWVRESAISYPIP